MIGRPSVGLAAALVALGASGSLAWAGDPATAERQYRVARRLAAERSADAAGALQKVIELDPLGPRADDALVEQARLQGLPRWPEELGAIDAPAARRALALLERVTSEFPGADRTAEARYLLALLRLEPLSIHDASAARFDLIAVATDPATSEWTLAARYAGAWLAAHSEQPDRAAAAYGRLLVDAPGDAAAARAATGLARLEMRGGDPGWAAMLLDRAVGSGVAPEMRAEGLRELAVRLVLARAGSGTTLVATPVVALGDARAGALVVTPTGLLFADDRRGTVVELSASGDPGGEWPLAEVHALAVDPLGRLFAATVDRVVRLRPGKPPAEIARLDDFGPPQALCAEATGRLLLLDRKGAAIVAIEPGAASPRPYWESDGVRLSSLTLDANRLLALDAKARDVVIVETGGGVRRIGAGGLTRPVALVADTAGRLAVLDARDDSIQVLGPDGVSARFACKPAGIAKPVLAGYAADGALQVLDAASGQWYRVQ